MPDQAPFSTSTTSSSPSTPHIATDLPYAAFTSDLEDLTASIILKPREYAASVEVAEADWTLPRGQSTRGSEGVGGGGGDDDAWTSSADLVLQELDTEHSSSIHKDDSAPPAQTTTVNQTMPPLLPRASAATLAQLRHRLSQRSSIVPSVSYDVATDSYLYEAEKTRVERLEREAEERKMKRKLKRGGTGSSDGPAIGSGPASHSTKQRRPREAAVLIPLINVVKPGGGHGDETELGILMQVRAGGMRMHAGEVR